MKKILSIKIIFFMISLFIFSNSENLKANENQIEIPKPKGCKPISNPSYQSCIFTKKSQKIQFKKV
jgi:hypothetical protein